MFIAAIDNEHFAITDPVLTEKYITFLKNTTTEDTHSSTALGTGGKDGTSLFDLWHLSGKNSPDTDGNYLLNLSSYDGNAFKLSVTLFLFILNDPQNASKVSFPITTSDKAKLNTDGSALICSATRRYGDIKTNADHVKVMTQGSKETLSKQEETEEHSQHKDMVDPYRQAIDKLVQIKLSEQLRAKVNKLIHQVNKLHKTENEGELIHILERTFNVLTKHDESVAEYQKLANKVQLGYKILGGLMMAIGSLILLASASMAGVDLGVGLALGSSIIVAGLTFFCKGNQRGMSKSMSDLLDGVVTKGIAAD